MAIAIISSPTTGFNLQSGTFVRQSHLLKILPFSPATLWRHVKSGSFPAPIKIGERAVAWEADAVLAWLTTRKQAA